MPRSIKPWSFSWRLDAGQLLAGVYFCVPLLALLAPLSMAPLAGITAAALFAAGGFHRPHLAAGWPLLVVLATFLGWCLISVTWSLEPVNAVRSIAMLAGVAAGGLVIAGYADRLDAAGRAHVAAGLLGGIRLGAAILLVATLAAKIVSLWAYDPELYRLVLRLDRGSTVVAVLVWPAMLCLRQRERSANDWRLFAVVLVAVMLSRDLAAKVAMVSGGLVYAAVLRWPKRPPAVIVGLLVAFHLLAPLATKGLPLPDISARWNWLPTSTHHRMTIWSFVGEKISIHPVGGWGFDSSRALPGGREEYALHRSSGDIMYEKYLPLHPHDFSLQIWLELGAIGATLMAALLWLIGRALRFAPSDPAGRAAATAALVAGFAISSVSFGAWQSWWLSTLWLAAASFCALLRPAGEVPR
jgi:O-antigen ligase